MKTLFLSFLILLSTSLFSQEYICDFVVSYKIEENGEWIYLESEQEENKFDVRQGYMYWTSNEVVRYKIRDVRLMEGVLHYFLSGKENHPLLLSRDKNYITLIFDAENGIRYALKYTIKDIL